MNTPFSIILKSPGPIALTFGNVNIRWYGIFIALAFLISYLICEHLVKKGYLSLNVFTDLIIGTLISSIISARLWFVCGNLNYFKSNLEEIPKIWHGGQSIHGAIFGGILFIYIFSRIKKINFYSYIDIISCVMPLAQSIGRWGNFFNNEAFGKPLKSSILKLFIPFEDRPTQYFSFEYFHPTFLYEGFLDLVLFIFLYRKYPVWKNEKGKIFWFYLLSYSIIRYFLEFIRLDRILIFDRFSLAQITSVVIILVSIIVLSKKYNWSRNAIKEKK